MSAATGLEQRVSDLEQRLDDLIPDNLQANYLTIDPVTGQIGADFTGLINALGLIMPTGTNFQTPSTPQSEMVWRDASSGFVAGRVYGYKDQTYDTQGVSIDGLPYDTGSESVVQLEAVDNSGHPQARLTVSQEADGTYSTVNAEVQIPTINHPLAVILRQGGLSDFVQLQSLGSNSPHKLVVDDNGGNFYSVAAGNQANGTTNSQSFVTVRPGWTSASPIGALRCVVHGTTTAIAVPWSVGFVAPDSWVISVTNQSGYAIDWQWFGVVIGI